MNLKNALAKTVVASISALLLVTTGAMAGETFSSFIKGGDFSFSKRFIDCGWSYKNGSGTTEHPMKTAKDNGMNYVRLRLWHTPSGGYSNMSYVSSQASTARSNGLKVLVTVHYSDTWCDPHQQTKPAAWASHNATTLKSDVYSYTKSIMSSINPDMIQIGNENGVGFLWPDCKSSNWSNFVMVMKEGVRAVRESSSSCKIVVHFAGAQKSSWNTLYGNLIRDGVDFDVIAVSWYTPFDGGQSTLKSLLTTLANNHSKKIMVAEFAHPWTTTNHDSRTNYYRNSTHDGFAASLDGQRGYIRAMMDMIAKLPGNKGVGVFYWPTDYVSPGSCYSVGSSNDNTTFWKSTDHMVQSSIDVWKTSVTIGTGIGSTSTTPNITTTSIPGAGINQSYSTTLVASGGTTPYSWTKSSGSLPSGVSLSTAGVISGTPTASGTFSFTAKVTDAAAKYDNQALRLVVGTSSSTPTTGTYTDIAVEAENYSSTSSNNDPAGRTWIKATSTTGYSGTGYVTNNANGGVSGSWTAGCLLAYNVNFTKTGTYNIWLRLRAKDGNDNSVFVGTSSSVLGTYANITSYNTWKWIKHGATLGMSSTGTKTIHIKRREDGIMIDKILFTTNPSPTF